MELCLVVGAGISGLLVANRLQQNGIRTVVIEQEGYPGGRMATHEEGSAIFDRGAQFVTTRDRRFREVVEGWLGQGTVRPWYRGPLGNMRYVGVRGMRAIPEMLAKAVDVRLHERVVRLIAEDTGWRVETKSIGREHGAAQEYRADFLVLTAPVPVSLELLTASGVEIDYAAEDDLRRIQYMKCLTVMLQLDGPAGLPVPGAMDLNHPILRWIGDNSVKGVSPVDGSLTVNSSSRFAETHWDAVDSQRLPLILKAVQPFLKSKIKSALLVQWQHSEPSSIYQERLPFRQPFLVDATRRLAMCGDGFGGGRIEAAALSGLQLSDELLRPY